MFIVLDTRCRNERRLAAVFYSKTGAFEVIHGLLDRVMEAFGVTHLKSASTYHLLEAEGT